MKNNDFNDDPFKREFNKRETKIRTLKSLIFLGFVIMIFLVSEFVRFIMSMVYN